MIRIELVLSFSFRVDLSDFSTRSKRTIAN